MKKIYSTLFLVLLFNILLSQKETNYWYFGSNAGLFFNNAPPVPLTNGVLGASEGSASISDSNGNLLFYTNGETVWNKNHQIMTNGTGLWGDELCLSSTQAAIIIPQPLSTNIYYIFTTEGQAGLCSGGYGGISYSIVDMSLSSGNGSVTTKNVPLLTPTAEKVTAVHNSNGTDIWIMTRHWGSNAKYAWLMTSSGLNTTAVISNIGAAQNYTINSNAGTQGYMKFSPDGKKLACVEGFAGTIELFDFNSTTGTLSNLMTLPGASYGVEFSSDSKRLYGTSWNSNILQWDLTLATETLINNSQTLIHQTPFSSTMDITLGLQLGSDCRIYVARDFNDTIGVIQNPGQLGLSCNYNHNGIPLSGKYSNSGLPNFIQSYFKNCSPVGINEIELESTLTVFPNPFASEINIILKQNFKQATFIIRDVLGQIVLFDKINDVHNSHTNKIAVNFLSSGIYFFEMTIDGNSIVKKIIKE